jgi:hypothetical protein
MHQEQKAMQQPAPVKADFYTLVDAPFDETSPIVPINCLQDRDRGRIAFAFPRFFPGFQQAAEVIDSAVEMLVSPHAPQNVGALRALSRWGHSPLHLQKIRNPAPQKPAEQNY